MNLSTVTHSIRAGRYQVKPRGLAVNHRPFLSLMPRPNMPGHFVCGINGREVGREIGSTVLGRVELAGSDELWRTLGPIPAVLFERVCLLLSLDGISQDVLRAGSLPRLFPVQRAARRPFPGEGCGLPRLPRCTSARWPRPRVIRKEQVLRL